MSKANKRTVILLCALVLVIIGCGVCHYILTTNQLAYQDAVDDYLEVYKQQAIAYLQQDEEFVATYGQDCEIRTTGWSYAYTDPKKYPSFSFTVKYPPTLQDFERELRDMQVGFVLPDDRTCTVRFEKDSQNVLQLVGWAYADE